MLKLRTKTSLARLGLKLLQTWSEGVAHTHLYSLARHLRQQTLTPPEAAAQVLDTLVDVQLLHLMIDRERFARCCLRPLKLVAA